MKKGVVISLGGSLIIPNEINVSFLEKFQAVLLHHTRRYKFVIVCGGGSVARDYIRGLDNQSIAYKEYYQTMIGIAATRLNARFMTYFFGKDANNGMPKDMAEVANYLKKNDIVFCGALRYAKHQTSDSTAAKLAQFFRSDFINLTNVDGLYDKNPHRYNNAHFIHHISHLEFLRIAQTIEFKPGQHFVLDQSAAKIIKKYAIRTFILGPDVKNLNSLLEGKHFVGTIIE